MSKQQSAFVRAHAKTFVRLLKDEVTSRFMGENDYQQMVMARDESVAACADLIRTRAYARFLTPRVATR
jgi:hypothetical protein